MATPSASRSHRRGVPTTGATAYHGAWAERVRVFENVIEHVNEYAAHRRDGRDANNLAASKQGAGWHARTQVHALIQPARREDCLLAEHPGCGFCCLGILDDRIQFDINQVAPIVHMLGEGG